jgi:hypothetical protein
MEGPDWNLAIVKQLLERQGGTINVKSKINEGSSFSFVLSFKTNSEIQSTSSIPESNVEIRKIKILCRRHYSKSIAVKNHIGRIWI